MSKNSKKRRRQVENLEISSEKRSVHRVALPLTVAVICVTTLIAFFYLESKPKPKSISPAAKKFDLVKYSRKANKIRDLLAMTPDQLQEVDIAEMNLLCAIGLPGAEKIDIDRCLAKLDEWAAKVRFETNRHLYRVTDQRYADHYRQSESYFRAEMLLQVLQEDCGVKYNPQRIYDVDFTNSQDLFIHGMIDDPNGGTCASMPVLYVAVGRRLGYPLFLTHTKGHLFVRWEDAKDRFNIEGTNGINSYPDKYYETWPFSLTDKDKESGYFLTSKTPVQEFASFLAARAHCLQDIGRKDEAEMLYLNAHALDPKNPFYLPMSTDISIARVQRANQQRVVNQLERRPIDPYEHVSPRMKPPSPFPHSQPIQPIRPLIPDSFLQFENSVDMP
jgi:tetratricopeptide (TPR) repeat protein